MERTKFCASRQGFTKSRVSNTYFQRLVSIRSEFDATREVLFYTQRNWDKLNIEHEVRVELRQIDMAERNLEATYFVRLFAEFEGILKTHLETQFPQIKINKFERAEGFTINSALRSKLTSVQLHRNSVAHNNISSEVVAFGSALSTLNTFLAKFSQRR